MDQGDKQISVTDPGTWPESVHERRRQRLAELEREYEGAFMLLAAIIRKYGEEHEGYPGRRIVVIPEDALTDLAAHAPEVFRVDRPETREVVMGVRGTGAQAGDRVEDGGTAGVLVECPTCSGRGLLLEPDRVESHLEQEEAG